MDNNISFSIPKVKGQLFMKYKSYFVSNLMLMNYPADGKFVDSSIVYLLSVKWETHWVKLINNHNRWNKAIIRLTKQISPSPPGWSGQVAALPAVDCQNP